MYFKRPDRKRLATPQSSHTKRYRNNNNMLTDAKRFKRDLHLHKLH